MEPNSLVIEIMPTPVRMCYMKLAAGLGLRYVPVSALGAHEVLAPPHPAQLKSLSVSLARSRARARALSLASIHTPLARFLFSASLFSALKRACMRALSCRQSLPFSRELLNAPFPYHNFYRRACTQKQGQISVDAHRLADLLEAFLPHPEQGGTAFGQGKSPETRHEMGGRFLAEEMRGGLRNLLSSYRNANATSWRAQRPQARSHLGGAVCDQFPAVEASGSKNVHLRLWEEMMYGVQHQTFLPTSLPISLPADRGCKVFAPWVETTRLFYHCGGGLDTWTRPTGTTAEKVRARELIRLERCAFLDLYELQELLAKQSRMVAKIAQDVCTTLKLSPCVFYSGQNEDKELFAMFFRQFLVKGYFMSHARHNLSFFEETLGFTRVPFPPMLAHPPDRKQLLLLCALCLGEAGTGTSIQTDLQHYYARGVQILRHALAHFHIRVLLIEDPIGYGWGAWLEEGGAGRRLLEEHGLDFVRQQV